MTLAPRLAMMHRLYPAPEIIVTQPGRILSIGQGARDVDRLVDALRRHEVQFLVDVRSSPYSRFRPEFSRKPLKVALGKAGVRYLFLGRELGGLPADPTCYVAGKVDYARCRRRPVFLAGLARLADAVAQGLTVCLMCSEGEPWLCHRSKLIGVALADGGVQVQHILPDDTLLGQDEVIQVLTGGQADLFGDAFCSRGKY